MTLIQQFSTNPALSDTTGRIASPHAQSTASCLFFPPNDLTFKGCFALPRKLLLG